MAWLVCFVLLTLTLRFPFSATVDYSLCSADYGFFAPSFFLPAHAESNPASVSSHYNWPILTHLRLEFYISNNRNDFRFPLSLLNLLPHVLLKP